MLALPPIRDTDLVMSMADEILKQTGRYPDRFARR